MRECIKDIVIFGWKIFPWFLSYLIIGVIMDGIFLAIDWWEYPEDKENFNPKDDWGNPWQHQWFILLWPPIATLYLIAFCFLALKEAIKKLWDTFWKGFMSIGFSVVENVCCKANDFIEKHCKNNNDSDDESDENDDPNKEEKEKKDEFKQIGDICYKRIDTFTAGDKGFPAEVYVDTKQGKVYVKNKDNKPVEININIDH